MPNSQTHTHIHTHFPYSAHVMHHFFTRFSTQHYVLDYIENILFNNSFRTIIIQINLKIIAEIYWKYR